MNEEEPRWISVSAVMAIHEQVIAEHGGAPGLRDEGLLDAALGSPRNHYAYERVGAFHLAAIYAKSMVQNHLFVDGNKRVALTLAAMFIERHGFRLTAPEPEAVHMTVGLASRKVTEAEYREWLRASSSSVRTKRRVRRGGR